MEFELDQDPYELDLAGCKELIERIDSDFMKCANSLTYHAEKESDALYAFTDESIRDDKAINQLDTDDLESRALQVKRGAKGTIDSMEADLSVWL